MRQNSVCFILLTISLVLNCSFNKYAVPDRQTHRSLAFLIELTDIGQKIAADSLGAELARRLLAFSEERNDFDLVKPGEPSDYTFKIRITSFGLVPRDTQIAINRTRNAITQKYDGINDSLALEYKPMSGAQSVAANVVSNVVLNAALLPLGFVGVMVVTDGPENVTPTLKERIMIDTSYKFGSLGYQAALLDSKGKVRWKKSGTEYYKLYHLVSEKEQLAVLVRNVVLNFEGKMPFLASR